MVERADADTVFTSPQHPYTAGLLASIPALQLDTDVLSSIPGRVPTPDAWPTGCRFEARCTHPADFTTEVSRVIAACEADPNALVAEFPGSPLAVTALSAASCEDGVAWETWHAYPQAGELVYTKSVVSPR